MSYTDDVLRELRVRANRAAARALLRMPRWAAVAALPRVETRVIRLRDLDWARVRKVRDDVAADRSGRVVEAWSSRQIWPHFPHVVGDKVFENRHDYVRWICPAYPNASPDTATLIARGYSPVDVSGGVLTRAEAHRWVSAGGSATRGDALAWLFLELVGMHATRHVAVPSHVEVVRWLGAVRTRGHWHMLVDDATERAGGRVVTYRRATRIDAIAPADLTWGSATGVRAAFEASRARDPESWMRWLARDHDELAPPPTWWADDPAVRRLATRAALVREGWEMDNCVGGYDEKVASMASVVVSVAVGDQRSTAELVWDVPSVVDHVGPSNSRPSDACTDALDKWLETCRKAVRRAVAADSWTADLAGVRFRFRSPGARADALRAIQSLYGHVITERLRERIVARVLAAAPGTVYEIA